MAKERGVVTPANMAGWIHLRLRTPNFMAVFALLPTKCCISGTEVVNRTESKTINYYYAFTANGLKMLRAAILSTGSLIDHECCHKSSPALIYEGHSVNAGSHRLDRTERH